MDQVHAQYKQGLILSQFTPKKIKVDIKMKKHPFQIARIVMNGYNKIMPELSEISAKIENKALFII